MGVNTGWDPSRAGTRWGPLAATRWGTGRTPTGAFRGSRALPTPWFGLLAYGNERQYICAGSIYPSLQKFVMPAQVCSDSTEPTSRGSRAGPQVLVASRDWQVKGRAANWVPCRARWQVSGHTSDSESARIVQRVPRGLSPRFSSCYYIPFTLHLSLSPWFESK